MNNTSPQLPLILAADDDPIALRLLTYSLRNWGYEVIAASNGIDALDEIERSGVNLVLLDWKMPGMEGVEVARAVRDRNLPQGYVYIILLTGKDSVADIVTGLDSGADDYLRKPANEEELQARIRAGERVIALEKGLAARATDLQEALDNVKVLKGLIPVCMYCKKMRDDQDYWQQMEAYIHNHTDANFTHSICPECRETIVKPQLDELRRAREKERA